MLSRCPLNLNLSLAVLHHVNSAVRRFVMEANGLLFEAVKTNDVFS
ncbi:MAG: hypothetical protein H0W58_17385 [Acidobacteria bacterium]|nr:hypothetical protein [Acidobacteriota bacterium]